GGEVLYALQRIRHQVDEVATGLRILRQRGLIDVRDAHDISPVADRQASVPAVVRAVRLHSTRGCGAIAQRLDGHDALVSDAQAGLTALRVDAVHGVRAPHHQPDARAVRGAAGVDDVLEIGRAHV